MPFRRLEKGKRDYPGVAETYEAITKERACLEAAHEFDEGGYLNGLLTALNTYPANVQKRGQGPAEQAYRCGHCGYQRRAGIKNVDDASLQRKCSLSLGFERKDTLEANLGAVKGSVEFARGSKISWDL